MFASWSKYFWDKSEFEIERSPKLLEHVKSRKNSFGLSILNLEPIERELRNFRRNLPVSASGSLAILSESSILFTKIEVILGLS